APVVSTVSRTVTASRVPIVLPIRLLPRILAIRLRQGHRGSAAGSGRGREFTPGTIWPVRTSSIYRCRIARAHREISEGGEEHGTPACARRSPGTRRHPEPRLAVRRRTRPRTGPRTVGAARLRPRPAPAVGARARRPVGARPQGAQGQRPRGDPRPARRG